MCTDLHEVHAHVESGVVRYGEDRGVEEDLLGDDGGGGGWEEPVEGAVPSEEHGRGEQGAKGHVAGDSGQVEGAAASLKVSVVRLSDSSRLCFVSFAPKRVGRTGVLDLFTNSKLGICKS